MDASKYSQHIIYIYIHIIYILYLYIYIYSYIVYIYIYIIYIDLDLDLDVCVCEYYVCLIIYIYTYHCPYHYHYHHHYHVRPHRIASHNITLLGNLWSRSLHSDFEGPVISGNHQIASLPGEEYGADARGHTTARTNRGSFWSSSWVSALKKRNH